MKNYTKNTSLSQKVENLKKEKLKKNKIVSLSDFRKLKQKINSKTILVVDDDEVMRSALKRLLENENYKVILASDGMELSKILESSRLDLILLDVNLPWVNGIELCRLIKSHHALNRVPLVFVSGNKTSEDIQAGFDAGGDEYITKPFEVDHLLSKIDAFFGGADDQPA